MTDFGQAGGPNPAGTPPAEVELGAEKVRALLLAQQPDLAHLPLRLFESGWDNVLYRLGDAYLVRLPRRQAAARLCRNEQRFLPSLAADLPLPVSAPVRFGRPGEGYPWPWSVLPWLPGETADLRPPSADQADILASFLRALHGPPPPDAPHNALRGVPLSRRADAFEQRWQALRAHGQVGSGGRKAARFDDWAPDLRALWREAVDAEVDVEPTWIHGDLHARNVLVDEGRLGAVIDWGDLAAGDRATDLAAVWMLLGDRSARQRAMDYLDDVSVATWQRARGWAVFFGVVLAATGQVDHPRHAAMGEATLRRVLEGP